MLEPTGRVDHNLVLSTFFDGADGILIAGCHPGDCHYGKGNYYTRRRYAQLKKVLVTLGLEPERIHLVWISAAEGKKYAEVINCFTEKIKELGPSPINSDQRL